jgi:Protein of unknown function (DUF2630)
MKDDEILTEVSRLVEEERGLRHRVAAGDLAPDEERVRLRRLEESLDQCWDLLRQRRAHRESGKDPDESTVRPVDEVEGYLQ